MVEEITRIVERARKWPESCRVTLARKPLETVEAEDEPIPEPPPVPRGRPVSEWIGLGAGSGPPPTDEEVKRWTHEHRMEKYG